MIVSIPTNTPAIGVVRRLVMAGAVLAATACLAAPPPLQQDHATGEDMTGQLRIDQGTTHAYGGASLGFIDAYREGVASISLWNESEKAWTARFDLHEGDILPAGGHFLRLTRFTPGQDGRRAWIELAEVADAGGIAAVGPAHPVLPSRGRLEVGLSRLELVGDLRPDHGELDRWPKLSTREDADPKDVERVALTVGKTLEFGNRALRVVRIQPAAGEIVGFVEFEMTR